MKNLNSYNMQGMFLLSMMMSLTSVTLYAQVGIGTVSPDASSALEVVSTTQGMLTPRMTTVQRTAIASPANGLMVYDTDIKAIHYYDSSVSSWIKVFGDNDGRLKFKRIKSTDVLATVLATELAAGSGLKYLLDSTTLYEINGTVAVDLPIELNNAYVVGLDSSDDKLIKASGDLFMGTTGGSIRVLTLTASSGNVFDVTGTGSIGAGTQTQSLILRDCIVASSSNVGKIENMAFMFLSIVQFAGNTTGIIYKDISKLLLSNAGWFGNNSGTYETLQGTFGFVGKVGGFSEVTGIKIGFDVSANPTITGDGVVRDVVFTGTLTSGKYINRYTAGSYTGFNFNDRWAVNSTGIPVEGDIVATGDINFDYAVGSGALTTLASTGTNVKLAGTTTSNDLYRFSTGVTNNRLTYLGTKSRYFTVAGSISFQSSVSGAGVFIFYIAKNGTVINQSKVYSGVNSSDVDGVPIVATVNMTTNDYIEVWVQRYSGSGNVLTVSMNLVVD
jgi:hypothetical protein